MSDTKKNKCSEAIDNAKPQTKETEKMMTPDCARQLLEAGNHRFMNNSLLGRNLSEHITESGGGQKPFAMVLNCIDSRVPAALVFDQSIGDIFEARVAGNFVNTDILGSMEFACQVYHAKLILVLGHTSCGAINNAIATFGDRPEPCKDMDTNIPVNTCDHIVPMLKNICPAVKAGEKSHGTGDLELRVTRENVNLAIQNIRKLSTCLNQAEQDNKIAIIGGIHDVKTGKVTFFEHPRVHA